MTNILISSQDRFHQSLAPTSSRFSLHEAVSMVATASFTQENSRKNENSLESSCKNARKCLIESSLPYNSFKSIEKTVYMADQPKCFNNSCVTSREMVASNSTIKKYGRSHLDSAYKNNSSLEQWKAKQAISIGVVKEINQDDPLTFQFNKKKFHNNTYPSASYKMNLPNVKEHGKHLSISDLHEQSQQYQQESLPPNVLYSSSYIQGNCGPTLKFLSHTKQRSISHDKATLHPMASKTCLTPIIGQSLVVETLRGHPLTTEMQIPTLCHLESHPIFHLKSELWDTFLKRKRQHGSPFFYYGIPYEDTTGYKFCEEV